MTQTVLISLMGPILLTVGGLLSWFLKTKRDEYLNEEAKSRDFKIQTYKKLLEPFIAVFTSAIPESKQMKEIGKIGTLEYKKAAFDLTTFGSDEALLIFNNIMQTFYEADEFTENEHGTISRDYTVKLLALISEFLLQIRKDIYSKRTKLTRSSTVEPFLRDFKEYKDDIDQYDLTQ